MLDFTERKFLNLPIETKHKKCAEQLRYCYDRLSQGKDIQEEVSIYNRLLRWMDSPPLPSFKPKEIADRYHLHIQLAKVLKKEHNLLPAIRTGDRAESQTPWTIDIYLDEIRSAHNVGSILRTTEAMALGTVYFSSNTPFIDHKQVKDAAMQTEQWVVCRRGIPLSDLRRPIIALETVERALSLFEFTFPPLFTLVVGNEEYGCSDAALMVADYIIEIPLRGRKNSLNVANAFAIAAGEISRQKAEKTKFEEY
ncbi:MAG: TrmH family RNA methyltransferase [Candidatus Protochlamydia sp.]|nr:TrmH family RNA methyltransferase [Candidatus Protochlamydia sp.]